jgi:alpha-tubulin suppressor-like RCC1 family protein
VSSWVSHGGPSGYNTPVKMSSLENERIVQIACGVALTAIRCESGTLYMFGMNDFGQCGVGTDVIKTNVKERTIYNPRRPVGALNPLPLDFDHAAFEKQVYDDDKYEKGSNRGEAKYESMYLELVQKLPPLQGQEVVDVSLGYSHGAVITSSGGLLTWGKGLRGQLGNGKTNDVTDPQKCSLEQDLTPIHQQEDFEHSFKHSPGSPLPKSVKCGATHTACLTACGEVYVWGKFQSSEVKEVEYEGVVREMMKKDRGDKLMYHDALRPRKVELPKGRKAIQIACSAYHTAILLDNYELYGMGVMISSGDIIPQPIPFTKSVVKANDLGEGWDENYVEQVEISKILKEEHGDSIAEIRGGSSANCTGIITKKGSCFTVFFCHDEPKDLFEDSHIATIPEIWHHHGDEGGDGAGEESKKVIDMAIGWHHALLAVK